MFMLFISSKTSSSQRILGLPVGLLDTGFHLLIFCTLLSSGMRSTWPNQFNHGFFNHHHHKHQGLDCLIRSVSRVTAARANASSVFQLFSFLVVCSGMISKGFGFVAFFCLDVVF